MSEHQNTITNLPRPALALAPMEQVTDAAYRRIVAKYGKPDLMFTEFTSADGLCSVGRPKLLPDLWYDNSERPIFAQIFGRRPGKLREATELCVELGFDGIDINMGCPEKNVVRAGSGAGLIENPGLAKECVRAIQEAAGGLPVSVKTRIGFGKYDRQKMIDWVKNLLEVEPAILTLHLRTKSEMSKVPAHWEEAQYAVSARDEVGSSCLIFGNGDVSSVAHAEQLARETGVDGVSIGRAGFGDPWFFNREVNRDELSDSQRLQVMLEHACLFETMFGASKRFVVMRRHFAEYVSGMANAKELRSQLVHTNNAREAYEIVRSFLDEPFDIEQHLQVVSP